MKVALIIPRYGPDIVGGAEYYARALAEKLNKYHHIEILTTCARDYHTWRNEYKDGIETINDITVRRFKNANERNINRLQKLEERVFYNIHNKDDELKWLQDQGPYSIDLIKYIDKNRNSYDCFIFFTFRYYPSYYGIGQVGYKSILVPFAENDPALNLMTTESTFQAVKGIVYSTPEEKDLIEKKVIFNKEDKVWDMIGLGVEVPQGTEAPKQTYEYMLYMGRIDGSKGCYNLFENYLRAKKEIQNIPKLLLAGYAAIEIPKNKDIIYLGFIPEVEKYTLLKNAKFLIMPSPYESLSIVTLEAMATGVPVLVNGECDVLKGHCLRSNGGLWYQNYDEFVECIKLLSSEEKLRNIMGDNGRRYIEANYSWVQVEKEYLELLDRFDNK